MPIDDDHLEGLRSTRVETIAELRRLSRSYTGEALRTLIQVMITSQDDRLKLAAADSILDRAWGKPPTSVAVTSDQPKTIDTENEAKAEFMRRLKEMTPKEATKQVSDAPVQMPTQPRKDH